MSRLAVERAAAALREAALTGVACAPVRHEIPDGDLGTAYEVQELNTEIWLRESRRRIGAKIGLTSAGVQRQLGVSQPDFGTLFQDMCYADGEEIPPDRLIQPRVEAEVALVLGQDLTDGPFTVSDVMRTVDYLLPAIEVVDSRVGDWDIDIVDTVADNASSGVFVVGSTPVLPTAIDLRLAGMVLTHRDRPESTGDGAACLGHPLTAATWSPRSTRPAPTRCRRSGLRRRRWDVPRPNRSRVRRTCPSGPVLWYSLALPRRRSRCRRAATYGPRWRRSATCRSRPALGPHRVARREGRIGDADRGDHSRGGP